MGMPRRISIYEGFLSGGQGLEQPVYWEGEFAEKLTYNGEASIFTDDHGRDVMRIAHSYTNLQDYVLGPITLRSKWYHTGWLYAMSQKVKYDPMRKEQGKPDTAILLNKLYDGWRDAWNHRKECKYPQECGQCCPYDASMLRSNKEAYENWYKYLPQRIPENEKDFKY